MALKNFCNSTSFLSVVLVSKKQLKQLEKHQKFGKIQIQSGDGNFLKNFSKMHKF